MELFIILLKNVAGLLIVRPKQAEILSEFALNDEMDAYVVATMGKEIVKSLVSTTKGEKLQWIQSLNLKRKASEIDIALELWYKDNFSGNDMKGKIIVDLLKTNVFLGVKPEIWLEIKNEEEKSLGKMLVEFEWKPISLKNKEK